MTEIVTTPVPLSRGTYAVYETPDGGRVLAYRPEGTEESSQVMIPAPAIRLLERIQSGDNVGPMDIMKAMMGH